MKDKNRELWLQQVRHTAAESVSWLTQARTLRQAAEDLWVSGNAHDQAPGSELDSTVLYSWKAPNSKPLETGGSTRDVCFMLFGFALENLAKGIIVCRNPKLVTRARLEKWHGKGHDLEALFDSAKIPLTEYERRLIARTSRITEWKGRYPVPMNFYQVGPHDRVLGYIAVGESWPVDDYKGLSALYVKAKAMLIETMKEVPPLPNDYDFGDA